MHLNLNSCSTLCYTLKAEKKIVAEYAGHKLSVADILCPSLLLNLGMGGWGIFENVWLQVATGSKTHIP